MEEDAESSTFTGGASAMEEDAEPIEWGDMDPAFRALLESTPAMLEAYKTLRNAKKMAKLPRQAPFKLVPSRSSKAISCS